jgi:hypothetical protein
LENLKCDQPESFLKNGLQRFKNDLPEETSISFPDSTFILNEAIEKFCREFKNSSFPNQTDTFVSKRFSYATSNLFDPNHEGHAIILLISDEKDSQSMQLVCEFYQKYILSNSNRFKALNKNTRNILYDRFVFGLHQNRKAKTIHNTSYSFGLETHRFTLFLKEDEKTLEMNPHGKDHYVSEKYGAWAHFRRNLKRDLQINAKNLFIDYYYYKCLFLKSFD